MTTFRPFGPSVALTARDMVLMPRNSAARASSLNRSCLGMEYLLSDLPMGAGGVRVLRLCAEDAEDVVLLHDEVLLAVQLDLAAGVLPEENTVSCFERQRAVLALVGDGAGPDGDYLAPLRLFLGGVGDDDAAALLVALFEALDEHTVVERAQRRFDCLSHELSPLAWWRWRSCSTGLTVSLK